MPTRTAVLLAILLAIAGALAPVRAAVPAQTDAADAYLRALALARDGDSRAAIALLEELARATPASVPVHRDLARFVLAAGDGKAIRDLRREMWRRLRRTARDVGANVAMAILEDARGRRAAAHRHLLTALTAGCRDPLLVPLLLATSPSPDGLLTWMARRRAVIPGDAPFRALEARALLARGRLSAARRLLDEGLRRDPEHPDLLALRAELLRAEGREARACEMAQVALGFLAARRDVPETRVPLRLVLSRILAACGRPADAEAVLAGLGPLLSPPGAAPLDPLADLGRAEVALAGGDPLRGLALVRFRPRDPAWIERYPRGEGEAWAGLVHPRAWARSIAARALVSLGLPRVDRLLDEPGENPPASGLALADREDALAARLAAGTTTVPAARVLELLRALEGAGLERRAFRLRVLAGARHLLPVPDGVPGDDPDLRLAREIAALLPGTPGADLDELVLAPAHGLLRAAWRTGRATALAAEGRWNDVRRACREGLLDLEEATRTTRPLPPEFAPLLGAWGEPSLVLPGLAARAGLATGAPAARVTAGLFHDLGRAVRAWSRIESPWPRELRDAPVPPGTCLVLATPPGPGAVTAALAAGRAPVVRAAAIDPLELAPCREAAAILWAGPAAPETRGLSGLGSPGGPLLVRLPHPGDPALPAVAHPRAGNPPRPVGADPASPLGELVQALVTGAPAVVEQRPLRGDQPGWIAFTGPGVAPAGAPASAGWLVPTTLAEGGWLSPESLRALPPTGPGLVTLGLLVPPAETEPAAWLLAESALLAGRGWALLSRSPLSPGEAARVLPRLSRVDGRAPLGTLRELAAKEPALAAKLELWTVASRVETGSTVPPAAVLVLSGLAAVSGGILLVFLLRRRRGRKGKVSP